MISLRNKIYIYDIETDGLVDDVTKIHCLSVTWRDKYGSIKTKSTTSYEEIKDFFNHPDIIRVGHNIALYDEVVSSKVLSINTLKTKLNIIDTLALSWYLYPELKKHGLEEWGEYFNTPKVEINDWKNLTSAEYIKRCNQDTLINLKLWEKILRDLMQLYDNNEQEVIRLIEYLMFKLDCVREQEEDKNKLKLDLDHINKTLKIFKEEQKTKIEELRKVMPKVPVKKIKKYKNVIVLDDGVEFFEEGELGYDHYFKNGCRPIMNHEIEVITGYIEPNPNSVVQKKDWLFSLGWKPQNIENKRHKKTGAVKKIYKMNSKEDSGEICPSIKDLYEIEPKLELLEGLAVLQHRIGLLEGFLENQRDGYIAASMAGLTNTLRLKHSKIVNLPTEGKKYGKEIRACIIAPEGYTLCGSDMSGLEYLTKQHYIYDYDPAYVLEMRTPGFDSHLDLGVMTSIISQEDSDFYKWYEEQVKTNPNFDPSTEETKRYKRIKKDRHKSKTTNYCSQYGAFPPKIASTGNIPLKEAKFFHKTYWIRNKAVKLTADNAIVKVVGGKKWIYNPVSRFWHVLRAEKDRFATLNSSTGVYCFDTFIKHVRQCNIRISLQMHDEILFKVNNFQDQGYISTVLGQCIDKVNAEIKLNVPLEISINFGDNYADCH